MNMFIVIGFVYIIGCIINYGLLVAWWNATTIASLKETKKFKKEAALHSFASWIVVFGTFPAVGYGKFGIRFR